MIWKVKPTREIIESYSGKSMESFLGIEITDVGDDYITGRMPANEKTKQPLGLLHGGLPLFDMFRRACRTCR